MERPLVRYDIYGVCLSQTQACTLCFGFVFFAFSLFLSFRFLWFAIYFCFSFTYSQYLIYMVTYSFTLIYWF